MLVPEIVNFGKICQIWHPELPNLANPGAEIWQKCQIWQNLPNLAISGTKIWQRCQIWQFRMPNLANFAKFCQM